VIVLGAGISGLSTAWFLKQRFKDTIKLTILEKSSRVGGWIQTIRENIHNCGLDDLVEVYRNDAERAVKAVAKRGLLFHYIFLDPPYKKQQLQKLLELFDEYSLLSKDGVIVCEHGSEIVLPDRVGSFVKSKYEKYGIIAVSVYLYGEE